MIKTRQVFLLSAAILAASILPQAAQSQASSTKTVIVSGLQSPRGLKFGWFALRIGTIGRSRESGARKWQSGADTSERHHRSRGIWPVGSDGDDVRPGRQSLCL